MYTQFFGLTQEPFSIAPDPHSLYMSESHREALAHLLYGIRGGGGFVVLTGEIGAGKTTICRALIEQVPADCKLAFIFNPRLSVQELLVTVCEEFGVPVAHPGGPVPSIKDCIDPLNRALLASHAAGQRNVLIIDEAQSLSVDVLEQLRLLTNLETNERKLLQIILVGQPELRALLARPELEQLSQRVIARFHLGALSADETAHYVLHRLEVAGGVPSATPFTPSVCRHIHRLTGGIPRRINLLCDRALLGAYAEGVGHVDLRILDKAAREVLPPLPAQRWRSFALSALAAGVVVALAIGLSQLIPFTMQDPAVQVALTPPMPVVEAPPEPAAAVKPTGSDAAVAWRRLAELWKVAPPVDDPCGAAVQALGLQCYRGTGGLAEIRQLGRPAVLTLHDPAGRKSYVLLTGLSLDQAWLSGAGAPTVSALMALALTWRGEFVTWWRVPPGYRGPGGEVSAAWLGEQLARVDRQPQPLTGSGVGEALRRFQRMQGLSADGVPGPRTLMQINRFAGIDEPRLQERQR